MAPELGLALETDGLPEGVYNISVSFVQQLSNSAALLRDSPGSDSPGQALGVGTALTAGHNFPLMSFCKCQATLLWGGAVEKSAFRFIYLLSAEERALNTLETVAGGNVARGGLSHGVTDTVEGSRFFAVRAAYPALC